MYVNILNNKIFSQVNSYAKLMKVKLNLSFFSGQIKITLFGKIKNSNIYIFDSLAYLNLMSLKIIFNKIKSEKTKCKFKIYYNSYFFYFIKNEKIKYKIIP